MRGDQSMPPRDKLNVLCVFASWIICDVYFLCSASSSAVCRIFEKITYVCTRLYELSEDFGTLTTSTSHGHCGSRVYIRFFIFSSGYTYDKEVCRGRPLRYILLIGNDFFFKRENNFRFVVERVF